MPIGYLITTSLVACGVLGAVAPPRRPFILGVLSFVAGFALNELPFVAAAWLVVSTLRALTAGLGAGWRGSAGDARTRRKIMSGRVLFAPFWMRRPGITRIAHLSYGGAGRRNLLDVYHGRPGTADKPVLIHLHGGALVMGRKNRESLPLVYRLASQGWVATARTTGCALP